MMFHYAMWLPMAIIIVMLGALDAGRKDIIKHNATHEGQAEGISLFIHTATLKQWSDIDI